MLTDERRMELRKHIARSLNLSSDLNYLTAEQLEDIDRDIDADHYWPRPIPVSERLPEEEHGETDTSLIWIPEEYAWVTARWGRHLYADRPGHWQRWDELGSVDRYYTAEQVTHWLPMLPPPE